MHWNHPAWCDGGTPRVAAEERPPRMEGSPARVAASASGSDHPKEEEPETHASIDVMPNLECTYNAKPAAPELQPPRLQSGSYLPTKPKLSPAARRRLRLYQCLAQRPCL